VFEVCYPLSSINVLPPAAEVLPAIVTKEPSSRCLFGDLDFDCVVHIVFMLVFGPLDFDQRFLELVHKKVHDWRQKGTKPACSPTLLRGTVHNSTHQHDCLISEN
jgi:hypothetical protein